MTTCDACQLSPATEHVPPLLWDWWGIEAGTAADLCAGCHRIYLDRMAEEPS